MSTSVREDLIAAMIARGKTRAQAEAFLDLTRSAFARRGWIEGEPDSDEQISEHIGLILGKPPQPIPPNPIDTDPPKALD